jgi:hypothetical protein
LPLWAALVELVQAGFQPPELLGLRRRDRAGLLLGAQVGDARLGSLAQLLQSFLALFGRELLRPLTQFRAALAQLPKSGAALVWRKGPPLFAKLLLRRGRRRRWRVGWWFGGRGDVRGDAEDDRGGEQSDPFVVFHVW